MNKLPYFLLRFCVGLSFFGHGLVRLPKLAKFSAWMVSSFSKSMLPEALVKPFSYALPIAEFAVGLLIIIGLFTRQALFSGALIMAALIFGSCMIESWDAIPSQLIHASLCVVLLQFIQSNSICLDKQQVV